METKIRIFLIRFRREISAILAGIGVLLLISVIRSATPTVTATIATTDLPAGHKISSDNLGSSKIPSSLTWDNLVTQPENLLGKITTHSIAQGQPLSNSDVISSDLLAGFDSNKIAISIPIASNRIDAYLTSGNHINVYAAQNGLPAQLVASDATVLFVPPTSTGAFQMQSSSETSLILAVNQSESVAIAANIGNGTFSFALLPNN